MVDAQHAKRRRVNRLIIAGILLYCIATVVAFRPWETPSADKQSRDALFAEAKSALRTYYATNKAYPNSIAVLRLQSRLAPHLKYIRTGKASCMLVYFSLTGLQISCPATFS